MGVNSWGIVPLISDEVENVFGANFRAKPDFTVINDALKLIQV